MNNMAELISVIVCTTLSLATLRLYTTDHSRSSGGRLASLGLGLGLPEAQLAPVLLGHEAAVHPALEVILALLPTLTVLVVILRQANLAIIVIGQFQVLTL